MASGNEATLTGSYAFIAGGRLVLRDGQGERRVLESSFAEEYRDRLVRIAQRHAWKGEDRGNPFFSGTALWGKGGDDADRVRVAMTAVCRRRPQEVFAAIEADELTALLRFDLETGDERRLFHGTRYRVQGLAGTPEREELACAVSGRETFHNVALFKPDGGGFTEVTEGDSFDLAPRWVPGKNDELVYQSAGVGRDAQGMWFGIGPVEAMHLDLTTGRVETLAADGSCDLLAPQMSREGELYYIRRPFRNRRPMWKTALDAMLAPVRFMSAIYGWLNFFTVRYSGKPLITPESGQRGGPDLKQLMVWGRMIDAESEMLKAAKRGETAPDLVPPDWELVRHAPSGAIKTVARGVLAFDLLPDGSVVYSNGTAIFRVDGAGERRLVVREPGIQSLIWLNG